MAHEIENCPDALSAYATSIKCYASYLARIGSENIKGIYNARSLRVRQCILSSVEIIVAYI